MSLPAGVHDAIDRGVIGFDVVKHLVLRRIQRWPARLDMMVYPYLSRASVRSTRHRPTWTCSAVWRALSR